MHRYAHLDYYVEEGISSVKKEPYEAVVVAKSAVSCYADYINYLITGVFPHGMTYE